MKSRIGWWIRWLFMAVVKPVLVAWVVVEGLPGIIRAIGSAGSAIAKALR